MGLFGRRRGGARRQGERDEHATEFDQGYDRDSAEYDEYDEYDDTSGEGGGHEADEGFAGDVFDAVDNWGPFDESEAPEDEVGRLDLGSIRVPVPDGAQLQVEVDPAGPVRAVHVVLPSGQITVNAYAAPRSGGLWQEVCGELAAELREQGARVHSAAGAWGQELVAALGELSLRFIGVDGPRWMLRGVVAGPPEMAAQATAALHEMVGGTVVVRGTQPMPVRTPLPIELPPAIAQHIQQANQG